VAKAFTDQDREVLKELHARGMSRNQIATHMSRGQGTISIYARLMGLSFDRREETAVATDVRKLDLAERRAALAIRMMDLAEAAAEDVAGTYVMHTVGIENGSSVWLEKTVALAPADQRLNLIKISLAASGQSMKLVEFDRPPDDNGAAEARGMLVELSDAARALAAQIP
jgi:hypothetical protein